MDVGIPDAPGDGLLVVGTGDYELALLALHDRRAGILATGKDAPGGDRGILQKIERHKFVVSSRFRVIEN